MEEQLNPLNYPTLVAKHALRNYEKNNRLSKTVRFIWTIFTLTLAGYLTWFSLSPFGIKRTYSKGSSGLSDLGPSSRVQGINIENINYQKLTQDMVYFSSHVPPRTTKAKIKIKFQNQGQELFLGFRDSSDWHYDTKLIDAPMLNLEEFVFTESDGVRIYQKNSDYSSLDDLINASPENLVGTYKYNGNLTSKTTITNYKPANQDTVIETPLRGDHIIYAYVKDEPFWLKISKQDLNWYEDADPVTVKIFKDNEMLLTKIIPDDSIEDASRKIQLPQEVEIKNPGPGLPEPGVYKINIEASGDNIITKIETNLSKLVFASPLFPVTNFDVYPLIGETKATQLFTEAPVLSAVTMHQDSLQQIQVNDNALVIGDVNTEFSIETNGISQITIPKNDVLIKALPGYFAFSKEQYFNPTSINILPVNNQFDLNKVDLLISDYKPPDLDGNWKSTEIEFDLANAWLKDNLLSWIIKAPGLKNTHGEVIIGDLQIELIKESTLNLPWSWD